MRYYVLAANGAYRQSLWRIQGDGRDRIVWEQEAWSLSVLDRFMLDAITAMRAQGVCEPEDREADESLGVTG